MLCIYKNVLSGWRDGSFSKMYGGLNLIPGTHKMRPGAILQPCSLSIRRRHRQANPWGSPPTSLDYVMSCSLMRHNFSKTKVETTHRMKPKVDLCPSPPHTGTQLLLSIRYPHKHKQTPSHTHGLTYTKILLFSVSPHLILTIDL